MAVLLVINPPTTTLSHASHACTFRPSPKEGVTVFDGLQPRFV